jgi:hypothetical protein
MLFIETTAPLLRATIMAVLIQLHQPVSCVLSFTNVPSLTKAVKQSNGHPNSVEQGGLYEHAGRRPVMLKKRTDSLTIRTIKTSHK